MIRSWILFTLLLVFTACEKRESPIAPSGRVVTIGVLVSEGENNADERIQGLKSLVNVSEYLKNGDKIELKVASAEGSLEERFDGLVKDSNLTAVISFLNSTDTLKLRKRIELVKIPFIATIATHTDIAKISNVSQVCLNNRTEAHVAASYLRDELFVSNVSVFSDHSDAFSIELSGFFKVRFERLEGVVENVFDASDLDQDAQGVIQKLKSSKVDTLYLTIDAEKTRFLLELLAKEHLKMQVVGYDSLLSSFKIKFPDDVHLLEGVFVVDNYADEIVISPSAEKTRDVLRSEDLQIASHDALSYDALSLLKLGLDTCERSDVECLNTFMRNSGSFDGVADILSMSKGNVNRQVYVNEIKDGKMLMKVKVF